MVSIQKILFGNNFTLKTASLKNCSFEIGYKKCVSEKRTFVNKACNLLNPYLLMFLLKYPLINYPAFNEELSKLLMDEYQFSLMRIVSDVEIIDGNPWWCKDFGTLNHPQPLFVENWTHVCYPKGQIISEAIFLVFNSPKKQTNFLKDFCPSLSRLGPKRHFIFFYTFLLLEPVCCKKG